jgi:hypothetical protein
MFSLLNLASVVIGIRERAPFTQPRALADFHQSHQRVEDGERRSSFYSCSS